MRYLSLISVCVLLFVGCSNTTKPKPNQNIVAQNGKTSVVESNSTKNPNQNLDWAGYYYGVLPCANCKGVDTWLHLYSDRGVKKYELFENFSQKKSVEKKGTMKWLKKDSVMKLNKYKKLLYKGSDFVAFINKPTQSPDNKNIMEKIHTFSNVERELLVNPTSVVDGSISGKKAVKLEGILNVKDKNQYKSLKAVYVINCVAKRYATSKITYYKDKFATGKVVDVVNNSEGIFFTFDSKKDVLFQALNRYCVKKK